MSEIIPFLRDLSANNNREWFAEHKNQYDAALQEFRNLTTRMIAEISKFDNSVGHLTYADCIYRIYRDIRFSLDKSPYKNYMGAYIAPNGGRKSVYAGYYMHAQLGGCMLSGGFYCTSNELLRKVRRGISATYDELKELTSTPDFKRYFGELVSPEKLKKVPKGFDPNDEAADILKFKHIFVTHYIADDFFASPQFVDHAVMVYKAMKPFNDYINSLIDEEEMVFEVN